MPCTARPPWRELTCSAGHAIFVRRFARLGWHRKRDRVPGDTLLLVPIASHDAVGILPAVVPSLRRRSVLRRLEARATKGLEAHATNGGGVLGSFAGTASSILLINGSVGAGPCDVLEAQVVP
jgi:hypothetical protein